MKQDRKYEELLSEYIDGTLNDKDARFVEETLLTDPAWRKIYEEMRSLRSKMKSLSGTHESTDSLWPAISRRLTDEQKDEKIEFIPARLMPVMVTFIVIIVGLGSFLLTRNWDTVTAYFDDTRAVVGDIYEQGILRGALQPLFAGVTNDDIIRFAVSGILEIPEADGQGVRVESDSENLFEIEFSDAKKAREAPSLNELYAELNVSSNQMKSIDSVLTDYKDIVRSSVFLGDGEEVLISPDITGLDKFILAAVAEQLEPLQRIKLNEVLNRFNPELHIPRNGVFPHFAAFSDVADRKVEIHIDGETVVSPFARMRVQEPDRAVKSPVETKKSHPRTFIVIQSDSVTAKEFEIPDYTGFVAQSFDAEEINRAVSEKITKAMQNTRIRIQTQAESPHGRPLVQVITQIDRPERADEFLTHKFSLDSLILDQFSGDHFARLRELSKIMQHQSEFLQQYIPQFVHPDTIRIPQYFNPFDESFEQNMKQLEFDLERLGEELEKVLKNPEQLMLMRDSLYFHLFPDTLER